MEYLKSSLKRGNRNEKNGKSTENLNFLSKSFLSKKQFDDQS